MVRLEASAGRNGHKGEPKEPLMDLCLENGAQIHQLIDEADKFDQSIMYGRDPYSPTEDDRLRRDDLLGRIQACLLTGRQVIPVYIDELKKRNEAALIQAMEQRLWDLEGLEIMADSIEDYYVFNLIKSSPRPLPIVSDQFHAIDDSASPERSATALGGTSRDNPSVSPIAEILSGSPGRDHPEELSPIFGNGEAVQSVDLAGPAIVVEQVWTGCIQDADGKQGGDGMWDDKGEDTTGKELDSQSPHDMTASLCSGTSVPGPTCSMSADILGLAGSGNDGPPVTSHVLELTWNDDLLVRSTVLLCEDACTFRGNLGLLSSRSADILGLAGGGNNCESGPSPSDLGLHGCSEMRCQAQEGQMEAKLSNEQPVELTEQGLESLGFPTTPGSCGYVGHADACATSEGGEISRVAKTSLENLKLTSHVRSTSIQKFLVCLGLVAKTTHGREGLVMP